MSITARAPALPWFIDRRRRAAQIYTSRDGCEELDESGVLSGGVVLPGFTCRSRSCWTKSTGPRALGQLTLRGSGTLTRRLNSQAVLAD
jgi:hypothetical protein